MPTTVKLEYFLRDEGAEAEDTEGNPVIIYYPQHMFTSEITSEHNNWLDAIQDVSEFMDIEVVRIERLEPKHERVYRIHTEPDGYYRVVWAKIVK